MDQRVERLKTPEECKIFARNAENLGRADLASEARQRSVQLLAEAHGPAGEVERACLEAIFAYEEVLSERNSKKTRAARTWQMIKRYGIVVAVERAVCRDVETSGYQALKDLGLSEYSFEAVVLKYPNIFSHEALSISKERILVNS